MEKSFTLSLFLLISSLNFGQSSIYGKVTDVETGEELIYTNIVLNKNGVFAAGGLSDFDGNYSIPVNPGIYELKVSYTGYLDQQIDSIIIEEGQRTSLDIVMIEGRDTSNIITGYKVPLIEHDSIYNGDFNSNNINLDTLKPPPIKTVIAQKNLTPSLRDEDPVKPSRFKTPIKKVRVQPQPIQDSIIHNTTKQAPRIGLSTLFGKVTDHETGEELIYANVVLTKNGVFAAGTVSDFDGYYSISLDPGIYELKVSYTGFADKHISDIKVEAGKNTALNIQMEEEYQAICICYPNWIVPLIDKEKLTEDQIKISSRIRNSPTKSITEISALSAGVSICEF